MSVKTAAETLDTYQKINNRANHARNLPLLRTVEAGQLNVQSAADYRQFKTWPKKKQDYYAGAFFYRSRQYLIPAKSSGVTWFAVRAKDSTSKKESLLVFDQVNGTYKLVASLWSDGHPIPKIATDKNGLVTPADPAARVGDLAPNDLHDAFEDLYTTGGKKTGAKLAATAISKQAIKDHTDRNNGKNSAYTTFSYFTTEPAHPKVYALRLADGGVLAAFPSAHTTEYMLKPQYRSSFQITPTETESLYDGSKRVVVINEHQAQVLAAMHPTGKPEVLSLEWRLVDSK
ncbi:hypothetical protein [Streptomyces sp. Tue6028]|uniref:hypothetical protein n=1 Tax=Streptomyces sp. Tue6028 TaxID=2036037 RepID=UPI003D739C3B